jgi:hypothetical protein
VGSVGIGKSRAAVHMRPSARSEKFYYGADPVYRLARRGESLSMFRGVMLARLRRRVHCMQP